MAIGLLPTYRRIGIGAPVWRGCGNRRAPENKEMIKQQGDIVPIEP